MHFLQKTHVKGMHTLLRGSLLIPNDLMSRNPKAGTTYTSPTT